MIKWPDIEGAMEEHCLLVNQNLPVPNLQECYNKCFESFLKGNMPEAKYLWRVDIGRLNFMALLYLRSKVGDEGDNQRGRGGCDGG